MLYADYQINRDLKHMSRLAIILVILLGLNAIMSIANFFTGWYFYIDALNFYHRGSLNFIYVIYIYCIIGCSLVLVIINKKKIEKKYFYPLLLFYVPSLAGTMIQLFFYGVSFNWVGTAISLFIIYLYIQNSGLNTDYLTGAYNRRLFEIYISSKDKRGSDKRFSAITLDFDGLKSINDSFGHSAGDEALIDSVRIIKKNVRKNDIVARTGGDEFIIISDSMPPEELIKATKRILKGFEEYNATSGKPYKISFSAGAGIYEPGTGKRVNEFFREIDSLMYKEKASKGRLCSAT
jgi:diguanylate cyclase (GGDEF)-like protein